MLGRLFVLALLVTLAVAVWHYGQHQNEAGEGSSPAEVLVLVPPAQARWLGVERDRFNAKNAGLYHVTVMVQEPGAARQAVLTGQAHPAACGADDPHWIAGLIAAWAAGHKGAHIAAFDDTDDYYVYFQSPRVVQTAKPGQRPMLTTESHALAAATTDPALRVTYPAKLAVAQRCAATLSAPWVTSDQRDGAQAFLRFLATRSALQDGLHDKWRPVRGDAQLTLTPVLKRYAGQGFRVTDGSVRP